AKDPRARYGSAREFVTELRNALYEGAGTTAVFAPAAPSERRGTALRVVIPIALLVLAAATGAAIAALLSSGGNPAMRVLTRTVAGPAGTTTIRQTVTQHT